MTRSTSNQAAISKALSAVAENHARDLPKNGSYSPFSVSTAPPPHVAIQVE